jgi:hypothetical protein
MRMLTRPRSIGNFGPGPNPLFITRSQRAFVLPQHAPVITTLQQSRHSSHSPLGSAVPGRKKVTMNTLRALKAKNEPITMITAHDFPSAHVADHAGMDMVLVGDSLAMVALGMEDTSEVLLEEMLLHCRSVSRGAKNAFTVSRHHCHAPQSRAAGCPCPLPCY